MYSQLQKLAILCNVCFWSTVIFQIWEHARLIPESMLNSIVILGISALAVNMITWIATVFYFRRSVEYKKMNTWLKWFIGVSAVCQVIWLGYNIKAHLG